jgi:cysteine desulfurase
MCSVLKTEFANPSSLYKTAYSASQVLETARTEVSRTLNCSPDEILFTGSATEASNQILKGLAFQKAREEGWDKVQLAASPIEHPSIRQTLLVLEQWGATIHWLKIDSIGRIDLEAFQKTITPEISLCTVMLANNETGVVQDLPLLIDWAHKHKVLFFSDCVQALGKIPLSLQSLNVDYAVFSSHKIYGPKGCGVLFHRKESPLFPIVHGGHQEGEKRAGTESTHNIAGCGAAFSRVPELLSHSDSIRELTQSLKSGIAVIDPKMECQTHQNHSLPNTLSICFSEVQNAVLMGFLDYHGISVSAGSACNTQSNEASHVLLAMGRSEEQARRTLRFSLGCDTRPKDIQYTLNIIQEFFTADSSPVQMLQPAQLDTNFLSSPDLWILDLRHGYDRWMLNSINNSHEASFPYRRFFKQVPRNRHILVVCQMGFDAPLAAFSLKKMGCKQVSFLMAGLFGWKLKHGELYKQWTGKNITRLKLEN